MTISGFIAYVKQAWHNRPNTSTPISAERLTHVENGIKGNSDAIAKIATAVVSQIVNDQNKIASMAALHSVNQKVTQLNSDTSDIKNKGFGKGTDLFCGQDNNIKDCNNLPVGSVAYVYGNSINGPVANENAVVFTFGLPTLYTQLAVVLSRSSLKVRCKYTTGWSQWVEK